MDLLSDTDLLSRFDQAELHKTQPVKIAGVRTKKTKVKKNASVAEGGWLRQRRRDRMNGIYRIL